MKRRAFLSLLGCTTLAWPSAAWAQEPPMRIVGYLSPRSAEAESEFLTAFRRGLRARDEITESKEKNPAAGRNAGKESGVYA